MRKITILLAVILSAFCLHQAAAQTSTYHMPFNRIAQRNNLYTTIDYSKLNKEQVIHNQDGSYSVKLPFVVEKAIAADDIFWLALAFDRHGMQSWGLYDGDSNFICKNFLSYEIAKFSYIVQSQDHLTKKIVPGKYTLIVNFSAKPAAEDLGIILGYSTRQYYDNYTATLEKEHLKAEAAKAPKYDIWEDYDSNGVAIVWNRDTKKLGMIDRNNKEILPIEYDHITGPDEHFGAQYSGYYYVEKGGKAWLLDKTGRQFTESRYDYLYGYNDWGYARVRLTDGVEYFIDLTGKRSSPVYDEITSWYDYYEVTRNGREGVIDEKMNVVIPCEYSSLRLWAQTTLNGVVDSRAAAMVKATNGRCYRIILKTGAKTEVECNPVNYF